MSDDSAGYGPPCGGEVGCKHPLPSCYCDSALEFQDQLAGRRRGSQIRTGGTHLASVRRQVRVVDGPDILRRRSRCIHGEVEDVWITKAYTNRHGAGAEGRCGRGYKHLFSLTGKEYRAVNEALVKPRLL